MSAIATSQEREAAAARRQSIVLVFFCTISGAAAQILGKVGMNHFVPNLFKIATNFPLMGGYALYGLNTLLMVLALKKGELSLLYPIIALTYVWVTLLSYTLLHEPPNAFKNCGIALIVIGVAVLGSGGEAMTPQLIRSMLLVLGASVVGSFGAVFLKFGSAKITRNPLSFLNLPLALGVGLYLGSSVFYFLAIRGGQLSILYPLVSLGYIWTLIWARIFFKETLNRQKFVGLGLILAGVVLVGMGAG